MVTQADETRQNLLHSERIFHSNNNRVQSPEVTRAEDRINMYRSGTAKVLDQPPLLLSDRNSERENHYRSILERIRENKKQ